MKLATHADNIFTKPVQLATQAENKVPVLKQIQCNYFNTRRQYFHKSIDRQLEKTMFSQIQRNWKHKQTIFSKKSSETGNISSLFCHKSSKKLATKADNIFTNLAKLATQKDNIFTNLCIETNKTSRQYFHQSIETNKTSRQYFHQFIERYRYNTSSSWRKISNKPRLW